MNQPINEPLWIGLDLGTQSVRALAVNAAGDVRGAGTRKLTSHRNGPRHEQDPEQWWTAVSEAASEALHGLERCNVGGVAVDATSGTILLADQRGTPVTPGLMYDDGRAGAETDRVNATGAHVWDELGYKRMQTPWALPKLLWLLNDPATPSTGTRLLHQSDFINERLTGHMVPTDLSSALKTGAHLITEQWPEDVFESLGVPLAMLPSLVRSGTRIGAVSAAAARVTGIPEGTPVISGATDGCAAQLGAGALSVGSWNSVLGTTLILKGVTRNLIQDPLGVVYSHKSPDGDWLPGGASSTGAGVISRDFPGKDLNVLEGLARTREPSPLLTYPLVSSGERFPFAAPAARGFTLGTSADEGDRYAAALQGVAFIERLCFDYLDLLGAPTDGNLVLTGGATKSSYWNQLRADVLGRAVTLPQNAEPALGMAVLAASPDRDTADVAAEMVKVREVIEPRPQATGKFDDSYLRLITELEQRGWLDPTAAEHAIKRTNA
ncbi:Xylulose kinase [Arthrobacter sp. Bi83]|uniref:FGGY-family carbohydrate kinase n=1 Tax=Arthrobacter sp. Bi83 TaxID=2822353 RepID=UPI001DF34F15|nr:FGGY family carbohydrate kinase [Arthrobacter sp. Bi83]CAH0202633.1 Xylulose kinase [Arthrobacter sp. Bi83]